MRKIYLMMLLAVVSGSAVAEWAMVSGDEKITAYADIATIRKTGNRVKIWTLIDLKTTQTAGGGMSAKSLFEFNCKEDQMRLLASYDYSENMGGGKIVNSKPNPSKWNPVLPESIANNLRDVACKKMRLPDVESSSAVVGWVKVTENTTSTFYADLATIRKEGHRVKMWDMVDYQTAKVATNKKPYMSMRGRTEYDCKEEQMRFLTFSLHAGNMGEGGVVFVSEDADKKWTDVPPGSVTKTMWEIACGKQ